MRSVVGISGLQAGEDVNDQLMHKVDQEAYEAIAGHNFYQCRCGCGFPAACGKYGCPNCDGDQGPAKFKQDMGIIRTRNQA